MYSKWLLRSSSIFLLALVGLSACVNKREGRAAIDKSDRSTVDQTAPALIVLTTPSSTKYNTNAGAIALEGNCESGALVELSGPDDLSIRCSERRFRFELQSSVEGTKTYSLRQKGSTGLYSEALMFQWILDRTSPAVPVKSNPAGNPHVSSGSTMELVGTCEAKAKILVSGEKTANLLCESGFFTYTLSHPVDGSYSYAFVQKDLAGNLSEALNFVWIRDTRIPPVPVITRPETLLHYSKLSSFEISGSCDDGATVILSGDANQSIPCSGSAFSFTVQADQEKRYAFSLRQRSLTEVDSGSVAQEWIYDATAPEVLQLTMPAASPHRSSGPQLQIEGRCEGGAKVSFRKNGVVLSVSACVDGTFGFTHTENAEGSYDFSFAQTDMAGNESASLPLQWIVESPAPNPPVVLLPEASPYVSNGNAVSISGSCTSGNTIHLEGASVDSMVCADSAFYFTLILGDGIHDFLLSQDNGTKRSTATSFQWIRDTSPPEAIVVSGPSTPWDMSTAEIAFTANETPVSFGM